MSSDTIIITGGAGFIGSVLCKELNTQGYKNIILVDRLRDKNKWKNLLGLDFSDFINADDFFPFIEQNNFINKNISTIFHMGACSETTQKNVDYLIQNNVEYSKSIFNLCSKLRCKLIYASSAATYGSGEQGYSDDHQLISKLRPLNPYGFSKQLFDRWILQQLSISSSYISFPPFWAGIKFFNVFGPQEYHKGNMSSVVLKAYQQIKSCGHVKLFKSHNQNYLDGQQLRDFVYVKDCVLAMIEMMKINFIENKGSIPVSVSASGIYNMGTGQARSFKDLALAVFSALNINPSIEYIDMPEDIRNQYQYYTQAEMQKLQALLPKFKFSSLENSVNDYVLNYLISADRYL
ncbi:MAG: ADP-glyceromanno-heptose 6-epimerase [Oligoflexia bacterium]|nr:ADP-glyceromanno-heptose 6-epimerase [Oligoflexia bacterium]